MNKRVEEMKAKLDEEKIRVICAVARTAMWSRISKVLNPENNLEIIQIRQVEFNSLCTLALIGLEELDP